MACRVIVPWRCDEHINTLELRAVLTAVLWLLSRPGALRCRVLALVDSSVDLHALRKGRSSAPLISGVLRKIAACVLASGMALLPVWVPSEHNPADGPSRGVDIGRAAAAMNAAAGSHV